VTRPRKLRHRCPVTDKGCYRDEHAAIWGGQAVMRLNATWGNPQPALYVYACTHCPWWHLTRSPGRRDGTAPPNTPVPAPDLTQAVANAERLRRERRSMHAAEVADDEQLGARLRP